MKKIIITGGEGILGSHLKSVLTNSYALGKKEFNILNKKQIAQKLKKIRPNILIHTAAITSIRAAELNKSHAYKTNVEGTQNLIQLTQQITPTCLFVYISTACVFDGERGMYSEVDLPYPKNYYSLTKYTSELLIQNSKLKKWLIIRTNFVDRAAWPYEAAFTDRYGTYLYADELAKALKEAIDLKMTGILHLTGQKKISMYELAKRTNKSIKPLTLKKYKGPPLTKDMSLTTVRWKKYKSHY